MHLDADELVEGDEREGAVVDRRDAVNDRVHPRVAELLVDLVVDGQAVLVEMSYETELTERGAVVSGDEAVGHGRPGGIEVDRAAVTQVQIMRANLGGRKVFPVERDVCAVDVSDGDVGLVRIGTGTRECERVTHCEELPRGAVMPVGVEHPLVTDERLRGRAVWAVARVADE